MMLLMQSKKRDYANDKINNAYKQMQMKQMQQQIDTQQGVTDRARAAHDAALGGAGGGGGGGGGVGGGGGRADVSTDPVATDLSPTARAFLNGVSGPESAGKYNVRYTPNGGTTFNGYDKHPGIFEPGPAGPSSAAGRYQFTKTTWDSLPASAKGDGTFSPANQDRAAWYLAQHDYKANTGRDLTTDLNAGKLDEVAKGLGSTWAGLKDNPQSFARNYNSSIQRFNNPSQAPAPGGTPAPAQVAGTPQTGIPAPAQAPAPKYDLAHLPAPGALDPPGKPIDYQSDPRTWDGPGGWKTLSKDQQNEALTDYLDEKNKATQAQPTQSSVTPPAAPAQVQADVTPPAAPPQTQQPIAPYDPSQQGAQAPTPVAPPVEQPEPPVGSDQQASAIPDLSVLDSLDAARGGLIQHFSKGGSVKSFADGGSTDDDDDAPEEDDAPVLPASTPAAPAPAAPQQAIPTQGQPSPQSFQATAPQAATPQPVTSGGNDDGNPLTGLFSAVSKGIRSLEGEHGLTNDAVPGSPQAAQGRQNFLNGKGAASPEQLASVKKMIDPTGQLNENLANCAALEATSNFWLERGEPEKAAKASGAMMLLLRNTSAKYGDLATKELAAGHTLAGLKLIEKSYDQVPDGHSVSATPNPDGSAEVTHRGPNGQVVWQGRATPAQLLSVAIGLKDGTEYWKQLIQNAGSKDPEYEKPDTQADKDSEEGSDAQTRMGIPEPGQAPVHISTTMKPEDYANKSSDFRKGADDAYDRQKKIAADRAAPIIAAAKAAEKIKGETQKQVLENEKSADAQFDTALSTYAPAGGKPPELAPADKADVVSAAQHIMSTPGIGATEANRMALDVRLGKSTLQPDPNPKNPGGGLFTRPGEPPVPLNANATMALKRIRATKTIRDAEVEAARKAHQGNIDRVTGGISSAAGAVGRGIAEQIYKPLDSEPKGFEIPVIQ